jgi:hypothetical protein
VLSFLGKLFGYACALQAVKLLHDLDALAPKPVEANGAPNRWLMPAGQAAVERAVLRHTSSRAWSPQQTVSVIKVIVIGVHTHTQFSRPTSPLHGPILLLSVAFQWACRVKAQAQSHAAGIKENT